MTDSVLKTLCTRIAKEAPDWTVLRLRHQPGVLWVRTPEKDIAIPNELALSRYLTARALAR